jgi:hypothetical protein
MRSAIQDKVNCSDEANYPDKKIMKNEPVINWNQSPMGINHSIA